MRQKVKQRIVGAVVLVALGVIFLPFLFTLEPPRPVDTTTQIPPAPDIEPVVIAGAQRDGGFEPPKAPEDAFMPPEDAAPAPTPPPDIPDQAPPPAPVPTDTPEQRPALAGDTLESWVIQVASFRDQAVAEGLKDKLLAAGYKAYVRSATAGGSPTYRIFVGPVALRERAVADQQAIDKAFNVQSMVVRFEP